MMRKASRHVKYIVGDLLKRWETSSVKKAGAVRDAFSKAVSEEVKGRARPVSFKKGTIMVIVESSPWLYRLTLEKKNIIEKFNRNYTGRSKAKDIRFRIGEMDEE